MTNEELDIDKAEINESVAFGPDEEDCAHCGADCRVSPERRQHAEHCPFMTGLWPIQSFEGNDHGGATHTFFCDNCEEEHTARYACPRCERYFDDGDCYRLVDTITGLLVTYAVAPRMGQGICTDCATAQSDALRLLLK